MIYISDSPVIPLACYGIYTYRKTGTDDLVAVLNGNRGEWEVAVTFPRTLDLIHRWTGISLDGCESPSLDMWGSLRLAHGDRVLLVRCSRRVVLGHFTDPDLMMKELLSSTQPTETDSWMDIHDWELSWVDFFSEQHESDQI